MHSESNRETVAIKRFQCRHIFTDGHRCGSPALRAENFCYFHHTTRKAADPWELHARRAHGKALAIPMPEDRAALLLTIGQVLQGIADRTLDRKDAGLLLYGLQVANSTLPREPHPSTGPARANSRTQPRLGLRETPAPGDHKKLAPVEDTVIEEDFGILAEPAEFLEPEEKEERRSLARQMMDIADEYEDRQLKEKRRKEFDLAVSNARSEALAEAYANLEELTAAVRATAIAETEARLRAESAPPLPATIPIIQAVAEPQSLPPMFPRQSAPPAICAPKAPLPCRTPSSPLRTARHATLHRLHTGLSKADGAGMSIPVRPDPLRVDCCRRVP